MALTVMTVKAVLPKGHERNGTRISESMALGKVNWKAEACTKSSMDVSEQESPQTTENEDSPVNPRIELTCPTVKAMQERQQSLRPR